MAGWITHLMIADAILARYPSLDKRGFCVGSIAPDCNVENEDWTAFTPPREATHWMQTERKSAADCEAFYHAHISGRSFPPEEHAFLTGYYAHLLADVAFQAFTRNEARVRAIWTRIRAIPALYAQAEGLPQDFDTIKLLIPRREQNNELKQLEAAYLQHHPDSGYISEILPLTDFPDYLDYMPPGCIVRKIGIMANHPHPNPAAPEPIVYTPEEFDCFLQDATNIVMQRLIAHRLI